MTKVGGGKVGRKSSEFTMTRGIPADASGASWPCPQTNNRIFPWESSAYGHSPLKDYKNLKDHFKLGKLGKREFRSFLKSIPGLYLI